MTTHAERLSKAARNQRQKEKEAAERLAIRERYADLEPLEIRVYGRSPSGLIDYDAAIQAASYWSNPPSGQARANEKIVKGEPS